LEPSLCVVSSWVIRVYTILVWNTISGSSNLDNCFYHCLILISISHLKALFKLLLLLLLLLLLSIIYIVNLPIVRPRSCWVIYYFDTLTLERRHQSFGRVTNPFILDPNPTHPHQYNTPYSITSHNSSSQNNNA